jgi:hypothetical protein
MFRFRSKPITQDTIKELEAKKNVKKLLQILEKEPQYSEYAFKALVSIGDSKALIPLITALTQKQNRWWLEKYGSSRIKHWDLEKLARPLGNEGKNILYEALRLDIDSEIKREIENALISLGDKRVYPELANKIRNGDSRSYMFRFLPEEDKLEFIPDLIAGLNAIYARNLNQMPTHPHGITIERTTFELFLELLESTGNQEYLVNAVKLKQNFDSLQREQEQRQTQIEIKSQMERKAAEEKASRTCNVCKKEFPDKKQLTKVEEYYVGNMSAYTNRKIHYLCVSCAPSSKNRYLEIAKENRRISFSYPIYADTNYLEHWEIKTNTDELLSG